MKSLISVSKEYWSFKKGDTQYSTHGIHTWLAAMIPQLAKKLIDITKPGKLLDPFCGGGSVCVEGVLNRIPTSGCDINPLSAIITKTKVTSVDEDEIILILKRILKEAKTLKPTNDLFYPDYKEYRIAYWFKQEHLPILDSIARVIPDINNEKSRTFFQCIFSATVRDVSLTHRNEIRLRKLEPQELKIFNRDITKVFETRTMDALMRLRTIPSNVDTRILTSDVKDLPFENNEFSTIICSPPYGDERNGVPYFQFAKNMLYWLGVSKNELEKSKSNALGKYNKENLVDKTCPDSKVLKKLVQDISSNKQSVKEAIAFYSDYEMGLKEMARVTSEKIVIVIGNRILNKKIIYNSAITTELFENMGLKLEHHFRRDLPSKRIPRFGDSELVEGGQIDKEDILIYSVKR